MSGGVIWNPAWPDEALGSACVDLRAGVVGSARDVLARTRLMPDFERRAHVVSILAAVAAGSNVAETWLRAEPACPDARLVAARVHVVRALALFDRKCDPDAPMIGDAARSCVAVARCWPVDPTPWVGLLALHRTHRWPGVRPEADGTEVVQGIDGPWGVMEREILPRTAGQCADKPREAGHRLLAYFSPRHGGRNEDHATVAAWLSGQVEPGHPWRLLPVVAALEYDKAQAQAAANAWSASSTRAQRIRGLLAALDPAPPPLLAAEVEHKRRQLEAAWKAEAEPEPWQDRQDRIGRAAEETYRAWFLNSPDGTPRIPTGVPITDVSLLAWALYESGRREMAGRVLRHLYPYASQYPWSRFGDPATVLDQMYRKCLGPAVLRGGSG